LFSEWIHFTFDSSNEFIEVDNTIIVFIKEIEKSATFFFTNVEFKITETFPEFLDFQCSIVVIIKDFENSLKTNNTSCSTGSEFLSKFIY